MRRIPGFVLVAGLVAGLSLLLATTAWAQSAPRTEGDRAGAQSVYDAEVPVNSQGEAERAGAFARALGVVLGKLSGDRNVTGRPGVGAELRNAKDYVDSYDYRQDQGTSPGGAPTFRSTLVVRFTPDEVDSLMGALGLPVWPQPRPKPVVWLAIDDGSGPRLVGLQQANAARPLLNRAVERGYKLGLPAGNAAEQALVGAIWRQDSAAVARASAKYSPPMQLLGKLYRAKGGWVADWVFVDSGKVLSKWTSKNADARSAMAAGADGAAEALMKRYGKRGSGGPCRHLSGDLHRHRQHRRLPAPVRRAAGHERGAQDHPGPRQRRHPGTGPGIAERPFRIQAHARRRRSLRRRRRRAARLSNEVSGIK